MLKMQAIKAKNIIIPKSSGEVSIKAIDNIQTDMYITVLISIMILNNSITFTPLK